MRDFSHIVRFCAWCAAVFIGAGGFVHAAEKVAVPERVPFVSGGVGEGALARLEARAKEFNLKLVFTLVEGNYLADVAVSITDRGNRPLLKHVVEGPLLMARLPAGSYTVSAVFRGQAQSRKVTVGDALRTEYFRWPSDPKLDFVVTGASERRAPAAAVPSGEIAVLSGGIGADELERLRAQEAGYNLKLVFTLIEGNYVADVNVVLTDAKGKRVVEHLAGGPLVLARLPAGQYTAAATYEGKTVTRKVTVGAARLHTEYLRWPANPQTDLPVSRWIEK